MGLGEGWVRSWDSYLIEEQPPASLVGIAREGRLIREGEGGPARSGLAWVDEAILALVDLVVDRRRNLCLVYPTPAGEISVLIAAQLLLRSFAQRRSLCVGLVTADVALAARTWKQLQIRNSGDRVPLSSVFPCWQTGPDGESPLGGRKVRGLLLGERCVDWNVDVLIEDHLAGRVVGDARLLTVALFADPLDPSLIRRAEDDLMWGWSYEDLVPRNGILGAWTDHCVPFSASYDRLKTIARGITITIEAVYHPDAELAAKNVREDLRLLCELAGPEPPRLVRRGVAAAWHHLQVLLSLPVTPSQFDRFAGVPPWAPRSTASFEPEIAEWARMLPPDLNDIAGVLASDLGGLRAALEKGTPFQFALEQATRDGAETLVITRSRAASKALLAVLGADSSKRLADRLVPAYWGRLNREGTWEKAIAVGPTRWDWHHLDSGIAREVRVLVLGDRAAAEGRQILEALKEARQRWGSQGVRERTWHSLIGTKPPPPVEAVAAAAPVIRMAVGPSFVAEPDPFDPFESLLGEVPLSIGAEGSEERLAQPSDEGCRSALVPAVEVTTELGRIALQIDRPVEVRRGSRIVDTLPQQLQLGDCLLLSRRSGRLGLLNALEERLRQRRPDLLAGSLLIEDYHRRVRARFKESGLTVGELRRRLADLGCDKGVDTVRSWVSLDGRLAPQKEIDLRRMNVALGLELDTVRLRETFAAVQRKRGFRRAAGRALAEAARSSTVISDHSRVDPETGLSIADLREAVVEARVVFVSTSPREVPLMEVGRLEDHDVED